MQRTWCPEAGTIIVTGPYWFTRAAGVHPCAKVMVLFVCKKSFNFAFFEFSANFGVQNRSVGKHLSQVSWTSIEALSTDYSLNIANSFLFQVGLSCVTKQNSHYYWHCSKNALYHIHRGLTNYTVEILKASHSMHNPGISYQCNNWCISGSRYQYHWERMVRYIQTYEQYDSITEKYIRRQRAHEWQIDD